MPSTTSYEFGDIVLVRFPFTDQSTSKKRPAVVVSSPVYNRERPDVVLMAVTGRVRSVLKTGDVPIESWNDAGPETSTP
jgi:mRNA interferase MazF